MPQDKSQRGSLDHLGSLAAVRLYRNDRQIKQVSYREIEAEQASYTVTIQLVAPPGGEPILLGLAAQLERLVGWRGLVPAFASAG